MTNLISSYLKALGLDPQHAVEFQLPLAELVEHAIKQGIGKLSDTGALCINTGQFTGRSPGSRFLVEDAETARHVHWNHVNKPIDPKLFDTLSSRVVAYLSATDLYVRCVKACQHPDYQQTVLTVSENPCQDIFVHNMFVESAPADVGQIDWSILVASGLKIQDFAALGLPTSHCVCLDLSRKRVLIIGTAYTGEIKKSVFSALNYHLPLFHDVLTMHCSANVGERGDTALFFGLSGTGKTTLSSDEGRRLIGDDEHGWTATEVFNFEGGCYAKTIGLSENQEPEIYGAIKFGALVENMAFQGGMRQIDFQNSNITENMRVSYPTHFLNHVDLKGRSPSPEHLFFLSADAFGALPPIAKLNAEQAMFYFVNGYTAKVAGTEMGVQTPTATFSACFGAAFMPLHPMRYADMLKQKLERHPDIQVWLVNTGWIAGPYGVGRRIPLAYTRKLIKSALDSTLSEAGYQVHEPFGLQIPRECPGIPQAVLNPKEMWDNPEAYQQTALKLKGMFEENFARFTVMDTKILSQ